MIDAKQVHIDLNSHFETYRKNSPYDYFMRHYTFQTFQHFIDKSDAIGLELGCSDGKMTQMISEMVVELDVVEGSKSFLEETKKRNLANVTFSYSLFENFDTDKKYDYIFATYIITHISNLELFLAKVYTFLKDDGLLFIAVPNARALSRQLALQMGIIDDLFTLSQNDIDHGHCRAYDRVKLNRDLENNGYNIISQGGIILKPLADFQMDQLINNQIIKQEQMDGLYSLGKEYPDLSGAIYVVCQKRN